MSFVLLVFILLYSGVSTTPLSRATETRVAGIATKMYLSGDYVVPMLNNSPFLEKPPLYLWLTTLSYRIFGISYWSSRLPSLLASIGLVGFLIWHLKKRNSQIWTQIFVPLTLITMAMFWSYSRTSGQDAVLALGVTLALVSLYYYLETSRKKYLVPALLGISVASLVKGIFGIFLIVVVIYTYNILRNIYIKKYAWHKFTLSLSIIFFTGIIPLLFWLLDLYNRGGWAQFYEATWVNSFGRMQGSSGGHIQPWYYYLVRIPVLFQPWLVLVALGIHQAYKTQQKTSYELFLGVWLLLPIVFLSASSSKRIIYLLSIYPAAALFVGYLIDSVFLKRNYKVFMNGLGKKGYVIYFQVAISIILLLYCVYSSFYIWKIDISWLSVIIAILLLLTLSLVMLGRGRANYSLIINLVAVCGVYAFYGQNLGNREIEARSYEKVFNEISVIGNKSSTALYKPQERMSGAAVYYLKKSVPELHSSEELKSFISENPNYVVISEASDLLNAPGYMETISLVNEYIHLLFNSRNIASLHAAIK